MNSSYSAYPPLTSADASMVLNVLSNNNSTTDTATDGPGILHDEHTAEHGAKVDVATWESLYAQVRAHVNVETTDELSYLFWKGLINDVQSCLLAMPLDERRTQALRLIMLAQSGAGQRYHYLYHSMVTLVSVQGIAGLPMAHHAYTPNTFSFMPVVSSNKLFRAPTNFVQSYPPLPHLPTFQPGTSFACPMEPTPADVARTSRFVTVSSPKNIKMSTKKSSTCHDKASSSKSTKVSSSKKTKSKKATKVPSKRPSRSTCVSTTKIGIDEVSSLDVLAGRGGVAINHEGNKRFRNEARKLRAVYQATKRKEKILVSLVSLLPLDCIITRSLHLQAKFLTK